jgi:SAM-dependent MidA family methyltransferase
MSSLKQVIIERIREEGPINFETFMDMALYYPGLGYYTRNTTKIGREGDFYTSPHLHPIFGAMMGRQMEEMWTILGRPEEFRVVEMGAGMGHLAKDMLDYLGGRDIFRHLGYTIIELNPSIKAIQEIKLGDHAGKVQWRSSLDDLEPVRGCFLSNELLDAFPVRMIEMADTLQEVYVSARDGEFEELLMPCSREVLEYCAEFSINLPHGYRSEVNMKIRDWIRKVGERLTNGFVLTIDYGYPASDYYDEERNRGTLLCYSRHQVNEDPYRDVGEQDMTAHVNFSSLKKWGEDCGLRTVGFCRQGAYLISLGMDEVITELYGGSPDAFETAKMKGMVLPQGMGDSHKVMVQYRGEGGQDLRGFVLRNHAAKL